PEEEVSCVGALWQVMRDLLAVLPRGSSRFILVFAGATSALAILDVAALGLLALTLSPMLTQQPLNLPVIGEIPPEKLPYLLIGVGALMLSKSVRALGEQRWSCRRF